MSVPSFMESAPCAEADPEAWFPEKGGSVVYAKRVCRRCDLRLRCLQWALDNDEVYGVWGGLSEQERRAIRRGTVDPDHLCAGCGGQLYAKGQKYCSRSCAARYARKKESA